jgi:sugar phosphate permease
MVFVIIEIFLLRDRPGEAGFKDFDTADASSGEEDKPFNLKEILIKILTNPIILTIAFIEFCSGIMRNGIMHWYKIFSAYLGYVKGFFFDANWGLLLMFAGVTGGLFAGFLSDKVFGSRRGPVAALLYGLMLISTIAMLPFVTASNKSIKKEMTVHIYHQLITENRQYGELDLEKLESELNKNYSVSGDDFKIIDGDSISIFRIKPLPGKESEMSATKVKDILLLKYERFNKFQNKTEEREIKIKDVGKVIGVSINGTAIALGLIVVFMSLCVIGVHGMLSGTATMDFGGRRAAATAVGLIDGFVYLGTGFQSIVIGALTQKNWDYWPMFLIPFALLGLILAIRIWYAFPQAKQKG